MTPFEYITVLISIVLGLGITQIVTGVADIIHRWDRTKLYWPHLLWMILVFFLQVQEWWWLYALRNNTTWELPVFLFILLYPIDLFILARILFPYGGEANVDLREFYFNNYRKFFLLFGVLALLAILDDIFIQQYSIGDEILQIVLLVVSLVITFAKIKQEWVHKVLVTAVLITVVFIGLSGLYSDLKLN